MEHVLLRKIDKCYDERPLNLIDDVNLNRVFGRILNSPGIVEVYGESGVGKSTLAMQIVSSSLQANPNDFALYICTDSAFSVSRFMAFFTDTMEFNSIAGRVIVQHLGDLEALEHFICYFLPAIVAKYDIRIVIIDSISSNFRTITRTPEVTSSIYSIAAVLRKASLFSSFSTICINQITSCSWEDHENQNRPSLGLSWSNCVSSRIRIDRSKAEDASRIIRILRSPHSRGHTINCSLNSQGFQFKTHLDEELLGI